MVPGLVEDRSVAVEQLEHDLQQRGWGLKFRIGSRSWANPVTKNVVIARPASQTLAQFMFSAAYLRVLAHESAHVRDFGGWLASLGRGVLYLLSRRYRLKFELRAILTAHRTVQLAVWNRIAPFGEGSQYEALLMRLIRLEGWRSPYWLGYDIKYIEEKAAEVLQEMEAAGLLSRPER